MELNSLLKIATRAKKRLGLGHGSGRVKTAGRGTKGQKARGKIKLGFEGGQLPLIRRFPYKKGFKSRGKKPLVFNVFVFDFLNEGADVTPEKMVAWGLVSPDWKYGIKILGDGEIKKKINVKGISCTLGARKKIESVGGTVAE